MGAFHPFALYLANIVVPDSVFVYSAFFFINVMMENIKTGTGGERWGSITIRLIKDGVP